MSIRIGAFAVVVASVAIVQSGFAQPPTARGGGFSTGVIGAAGSHPAFTGRSDPLAADGAWTAHSPQDSIRGTSMTQASPDTLLARNDKLDSKLQPLLPAGMTPQQACTGFGHLGDCVAAMHVASNLGIPFGDLKSRLTGSSAETLGSAVHEMRPSADVTTVLRQARHQAQRDFTGSSQ